MCFLNLGILKNISSLTIENLIRLFVGLIVTVSFARILGPEDFGRYSYIITFVLVFIPFFNFGMDDIITKELVANFDKKESIIKNSNIIRILSSLIGLLFLFLCFYFFARDIKENFLPLSVFSLGYVIKSFETYKLVFTSQVIEGRLVLGRIIIFLLIASLKLFFVFWLKSWTSLVIISSLEAPALILYTYLKYKKSYLVKLNIEYDSYLMKRMLKVSFPLFLIQFLSLANAKVDQIMIAKILNYENLSYYATSAKLIELWSFVPTIITVSIFPMILSSKDRDQVERTRHMYGVPMWFGVVLILGVWIVKDQLIDILYGKAYDGVKDLITLYSASFLFQIFNISRQKHIIVKGQESIAVAFTCISLLLNMGMNYYFIKVHGSIGAIYGTIASQVMTNLLFSIGSQFYRDTIIDLVIGFLRIPFLCLSSLRK